MTGRITRADVAIQDLGACRYPSPVAAHLGDRAMLFVGAADKVLVNDCLSDLSSYHGDVNRLPAFELAGPRNQIFFDPRTARAGIVTCGGLCPGLNNVIRGIVFELWFGYGVKKIQGFRYGYEGLVPSGRPPIPLTPEVVDAIHHQGGTLLGSSRGNQDPAVMVDTLEAYGIDVLFVIGGDGTIRGAMSIVEECKRRASKIAVVGIPKTIDNDIHFIDRSFGFESAYSASVEVIRSAKVEALCARDGIGLVKLMGRHSGFVACHAALASTDVDLVLIPEAPLVLDGPRGVLAYLERVLDRQGHAVIVVAEGAGQDLFQPGDDARDKSGNVKLKDIGVLLRDEFARHFRQSGRETTLKHIDPSYQIRSVPASPSDSVYCWNMARNAVHAAMAGNTEMLIGRWHGRFVHVPMPLATRSQKHVLPGEDLWLSVVESTGQPRLFGESRL
ncbi:MAG: diphosphate--fructose-6-phosphate 1-phosphotransferase [Sorangiineae bacterium NIC37A_2]|nr:MAG: diphosphate--fructose-6-phosphate 1-phosphotransferase [Sorangiineae bacterium NIC37A_2]